jgi:hypothetical protein
MKWITDEEFLVDLNGFQIHRDVVLLAWVGEQDRQSCGTLFIV